MSNFEELLQAYFNQSTHYLAPAKIKYLDTVINQEGIIYTIDVGSTCDHKGYELITIQQNDLLVWIYNHGH